MVRLVQLLKSGVRQVQNSRRAAVRAVLVVVFAAGGLWTTGTTLMTAGCAFAAPMGGDVGATTGGQQDIAAARAAIEAGDIPDPESITVEGFMSEHAIEIETPPDAGILYTNVTAAWHHDFDAYTPHATLVIGFGTTIDMDTFARPPLNLCLVIDKSGSMDDVIEERSEATKLDAVKIAIDRMLAQLTGDDLVSIVTFTDRGRLVLDGVPGDDIASIKTALSGITASGRTNLAAGMRRGYRTVNSHRSDARSDRLLVFTDAELRSRQESAVRDFISAMEEYAEAEIGATLFGVGTNFGHEVAYDIAQVRGGNYFFLSDYDRIVSVFDEEFDFLVTPIAYDVALEVNVPFSFDVVEVHGIETEEPYLNVAELTIPTVFFSSRAGGGAIMMRMRAGAMVDFDLENTLAEVSLSYETPEGLTKTQEPVSAVLPSGLDSTGEVDYFQDDAARRAVLLLNTAIVLHKTCEDAYAYYGWYYSGGDYGRAVDRLTEFLPYFDELAEGLEDQASSTSRKLSDERALLAQLLENL